MPLLTDEDLLARLLAFDTTSHKSNLALIDFVASYVERTGVVIERSASEDGVKANLLCRVGSPRDDRSGLTLCGHTDVVPALEEGWKSDPFTLRESDGQWFGRGSCDMKGFIALAIQRFAKLSATTSLVETLRAPLALLLTYDEEVGSLGVQRLASDPAHEQLPRSMIIGEPTELRAIRMHKGHLRLQVETEGKSAHSGYPDRGSSAIEPAAEIVCALAKLRRQLVEERVASSPHFPRVPYTAMNIATIRGGSAVNVIPDACSIELGVRLLPGVDATEVTERIREAICGAVGESGWTLLHGNVSPPLEVATDAPIHVGLCNHLGVDTAGSTDFSSDGGTLANLGFDCLLYGPGSIEVAHRPNEFLPRSEFERAGAVVDQLLQDFCF